MIEVRHALITGGSSGIGKATAKLLARQGADTSIVARTPERLEEARREIEAVRRRPDQQVIAIAADVTQRSQVEKAIRTAIEQAGPIDLLLTSAGMAHPGHFRELPLEVFEQSMTTNYFGALYAVKAAVEVMEAQRRGQIVLISSGVGLLGIYGYTAYSPTKFALRGLAETLRGELKGSNISVSIVYPPDTDTPQLEQENRTKPEATRRITGTAGVWSPEDVGRVILRGIRKKAFVIAPGFEMKVLARFHSLLAPVFNWYFDRIVARVDAETSSPDRSGPEK